MLNLNDLFLFVRAVEHGGFAAASRRLGIPKSTVSKRVAELEAALGARLIHRTSRSFVLTELGRDFYRHARAAMIETEAAEDVVRSRAAEPSGTVRITTSVPVAQAYLAEQLPRLAETFPRLHLQLDVSDRFVDVVQEGYDIALRCHFAPLPDSGLVQRQVMVEPIILVAAPAYLERQGRPSAPEDLAQHWGLLTGPQNTRWVLTDGEGREIPVAPLPRMTANESTVLTSSSVTGLGITCLPEMMCRGELQAGKLVRVLPEWHCGSVTTTIVMPHRRGLLPGVRAVVEFLVENLRRP
ncbi:MULTISPECIES: LysR substrate-binding domain-containing protein [unclassified Microbulbifer]|uniref:LysR substrate-binding domain-containing protein n=1 Tax=unclassified Microbulbifer TaxID=2619833 RepID=UPI0027E41A4A|nr:MULTISPECIES: LysR substrate-binding domain-containing protein [unclassified Microbulbifer]